MSGELFPEPHEPTDQQVVAELERELDVRRGLYPHWVRNGKLEQRVADHRIRCLELALEAFQAVLPFR